VKKALFLDRDGVVNREHGFTFEPSRFEILPDLVEALCLARDKGYKLIIVSNQSGIAKGLYTAAHVEILHEILVKEVGTAGVKFDEIYYCVHHPDVTRCICRKPDSLFVEKALARFDLDPAACYFIGDKERDVQAAEKAGVKGVLIPANTSILGIVKLFP
jgi:D-glycero-D-manno-heptose 1,7-bisphosphate phosphatase